MNKGVLEGFALLLVGIVGIIEATRLIGHTSVVEDVTGPGRYLMLVSFLLAVGALVFTWDQYRRPAAVHRKAENDTGRRNQLMLIVAALVVYVVLIEHVGYAVSTFAFCAVTLRLLGRDSWPKTLLIAVGIVIVLYLVFIDMSGMIFPRGTLLF